MTRYCNFCQELIPETKLLIRSNHTNSAICEDCVKKARDKTKETKDEKDN